MPRLKCKRKNYPHFIDRIGVELEGAFKRDRTMQGTFHQDISVEIMSDEFEVGGGGAIPRTSECQRNWSCECDYCAAHDRDDGGHRDYSLGEYVSHPIDAWGKYTRFVKRNFPDVVNESCGTHIHASFTNMIYMSGMLECATEICETLHKAYTQWGKSELSREEWSWFKGRLDGNNTYCRRGHNAISITGENRFPDFQQEKYVTDDRYHWLNYQALDEHGTVECRLLPGFKTADKLIEATNILFNVYRRVLYKYIRGSGIVYRSLMTEGLISAPPDTMKDVTVGYDGMAGVDDSASAIFYNSVMGVEYTTDRADQRPAHIGPHESAHGAYVYKVKQTQAKRGLKKKIKTPPSRGNGNDRYQSPSYPW